MRLPYFKPPKTSPSSPQDLSESQSIIQSILNRRSPRHLTPLDLTLLHSPPLAAGYNTFLSAVRTQTTSLPADLRELAICRVAVLTGAMYVWTHHSPLLLQCPDWTVEMLDLIKNLNLNLGEVCRKGGLLSEEHTAVLRYTDAMTRDVKVRGEVWEQLREKSGLDERGIVELTATVATYNMVSRVLVALDVGEMNGANELEKEWKAEGEGNTKGESG